MNEPSEQQLLRDYAERHSEAAFSELVRRHVDLVYSAALRMVRDPEAAQDITQMVFVALAQNARPLTRHPVLAGWLHCTTRNLVAKTLRTDARRRNREQEAAVMNELLSAPADASWEEVAPHLDAALGELDAADRDAVLLRYFKRQSAHEMAATLGISAEAAQKRVHRAVDRLRQRFQRRGIAIGAGGLATLVSANAVQVAPAGLAVSTATAALAGAAVSTTAFTLSHAFAMTTVQKTLVGAVAIALVGTGIYKAHQARRLQHQVQTLQQEHASLAEHSARLAAEKDKLSNQLAAATAAKPTNNLSKEQWAELLKLRGRATLDSREIAALKSMVDQSAVQLPDFVTNYVNKFLSSAESQFRRAWADYSRARIEEITSRLNLTAEQRTAVESILKANIEPHCQVELSRISGDLSPDEGRNQREGIAQAEDQAISAVLNPDQAETYKQMRADDETAGTKAWIERESASMRRDLKLTDAQVQQVGAALASLKSGAGGGGITFYSDANEQLVTRLQALQPFLNAEQLEKYRQIKKEDIDQHLELPKLIKALKRR